MLRVSLSAAEPRLRLPAMLATIATFAAFLIFFPSSVSAAPSLVTNGLTVNLDSTNTASLAASSPTSWTSISPGSYAGSGSFYNAPTRGNVSGVPAVQFNGVNQAVDMGAGVGRSPGDLTVETWVNPASLKAGWNIFATRWFDAAYSGAQQQDWHFGFYDGGSGPKLNLYTTGTSDKNGPTTITTNKWYLVGFTITGSTAQLYLNGKPEGSAFTVSRTDSANASLWLGDGRANVGLNGAMSKFRIYTAGLSAAQMNSNFMSESGAYGYPVVTFSANDGGSTADTYQTLTASASTALTANTYSRTGYSFAGWNTAPNGSGTSYTNSQAVSLTADLQLYAQWTLNAPTNSGVPTISGTAKVGQTYSATDGTWISGTTPTLGNQWQRSTDGSTWSDISGATGSTYTLVAADGAGYVRLKQTASNAAGSTTAFSVASALILSENSVTGASGSGGDIGSMFTVANDSKIYNVTLTSSNLNGLFSLGTTTGLTWVEGYSTTASYMPTSISGTGSIFSFRGTGTAINTALATLKYTSATAGTDVLKMSSAEGGSSAFDIRNYIPIYDNGKLTFHYYSITVPWPTNYTRAQVASTLSTTYSMSSHGESSVSITSPNVWHLQTSRYAVEDTRAIGLTLLCSTGCWTFAGGLADAGSSQWYWPANTDGFSSATNVSFTNWAAGNPDLATTSGRVQLYIGANGTAKWDDKPATESTGAYLAETYSTSPLSATTSTQTYRAITAPGAPTGLTVTSTGKTTATLNWVAPASAGTDAITDYKIQYSTDNATWSTWSHTASTAVTANVTGLPSDKMLWFRVAAVSSVTGTYSGSVSSALTETGSNLGVTGFNIPSTMTGTIRVLVYSSNPAGKLSFTDTTGITTGIRNTANYPDTTAYTPITGFNPATIGSAGRMVGLVDTSVSELNAALASLKYSSATASTDTIKMWVSNGSEYIPIVNGSNVEFHYYGYTTDSLSWATAYGTSGAGQARTLDGVSLAAGTSFLATPRYRAEAVYAQSLAGTNHAWFAGSDSTADPVNSSEGVWRWIGPDTNRVQFSSGSTAVNGEFNNWGASSSSAIEPNGGTGGNCLTNYYSTGYTGNTIPTSGTSWDDTTCTTGKNYVWEAFSTNAPYGSNTSNPAAANYAAPVTTQNVVVSQPPAAPTGLTATSTINGQVDLSWVSPAGVTGIASYAVQYSADGTTWTETRTSASTATTHSIPGLASRTYYQIRVAAIVSGTTGYFASTYFTPKGDGRATAIYSTAKNISSLQIDSGLASRYVRVLLRVTNPTSSISLATPGSTGGIRGTANYTTRSAGGQMIGLTGLGSAVNTALQSLQFTGPSSNITDSISMWVSAGTTSDYSREFVPVVNSRGEVEFHYFGLSSASTTWQGAQNVAASESTLINGQSALGKFVATPNSADQNAMVATYFGSTAVWLGGGDYTTVNSANADGAWYFIGPDTGTTQFYNGGLTGGSAAVTGGQFAAWFASSSTAQGEPNSGIKQNCLATRNGATHVVTGAGFITLAAGGGISWDDSNCESSIPYLWEYMANEPVGTNSVGDNYTGMTAQAVVVLPPAEASSSISAVAAGTTSAVVSWNTPTVNASTGITGYKIEWANNSSFTSSTTVSTGSTNTFGVVTGLTANTAYYFRVWAVGSGWEGLKSASATATTRSTASTLNIVASGGGVAGTDYLVNNGALTAVGATASISKAELETLLAAGDVVVAADVVNVNAAVSWSTNKQLQLGATVTSTVAINADISATGNTAGLTMPAACAYGTTSGCYSLDTKNGANITLSGTSPSLKLGADDYTVITTAAALKTFGATAGNQAKKFAIGSNIDLSADLFSKNNTSSAPMIFNTTGGVVGSANMFSGTFDGLGNAVQNFTMNMTAWENGFFYVINGGTVRNVGFTNINYTTAPYASNVNIYMGAIAGSSQGTVNIDQVWVTGSMSGGTGTFAALGAGSMIALAQTGSLKITRSWSSAAMNFGSQTTSSLGVGGILGASAPSIGGGGGAANVTIEQAYTSGPISVKAASGWNGAGGIMGLNWTGGANPTVLTDVFAWGQFSAAVNHGGILGLGGNVNSSTITRGYTSYSTCVNPGSNSVVGASTSCYVNQKPGVAVTGLSGSNWGTTNGSTLTNLVAPQVALYVQPVTPTDGSFATVGYKIVDALGNDYTASLASYSLTVSGTPTWDTMNASSPVGTYLVTYTGGLTLGGAASSAYTLSAWLSAIPIQITKLPQSVTWSPSTTIAFGSGTTTPSSLASANTTITYSVVSAGTAGCSVNSSTGAISYSTEGTCSIKASAANAGNYLAAETTVTFTVRTPSPAPSDVTVTGSGQTTAVIGWTAPTVNATTAITGYTVKYATNAAMTGATTAAANGARPWVLLTGLTANTTYYVTVTPTGSGWTGTTSAVASGVTKTVATSITIVSSGGGTPGTEFTSKGGAFAPNGAISSAAINASDIQAALAVGDVLLAADTVTITGPLSWSSNSKLILNHSTSSTLNINADITASGTSAGIEMKSSTYALDTKSGANITLSGASASLSIGGNAFTLIDDVADFASVQASGQYALAKPITFTNSSSSSPMYVTYAGVFDGLGNTVNNMTIVATTTGNYGLFWSLGGATVRNLGIINASISSSTASLDLRLGALAGNGSSTGTNTVSQVWATGTISQTATTGRVEAGGLFGGATGGTLNLSKSWSSVAVTTYAPTTGVGGIIGANVSYFGGGAGVGNTLSIGESYSTGNILRVGPTGLAWYGSGGIIGVAYGARTTITDTFSWSNVNSTGTNAGTSNAGIVGVGAGATYVFVTNAYTVNALCAPGSTVTNCQVSQTAGAAVTGFSSGTWSSTNGASLTNVAPPTKALYVQVVAPTNGSYAGLSYRIVDSTGTTQTLSSLNVSLSGTPTYTISDSVARGTYSVNYVSGLTLDGSSASVYSLYPWTSATSVTITRLAQTVTWSPTTALLRTDTGTTVAAAATTGDSTITYAVTSAGSTGCAINSTTRVLTFTAEGSCTVTATAPQTTNFTAATQTATFVVSVAPPLAPTGFTVSAGSASGQLSASWTAPSTSTTGGTIASYDLEISTDGVNYSALATALVATTYTATGLTNGTGYKFRIRATNTAGQTSSWFTSLTSTKPYAAPLNLTLPTITGSPIGGIALSADAGTWNENGNALSSTTYQWQISDDGSTGWTNLSSATSSTYTPSAAQAGKYLAVVVTATNAAGSTSAQSVATSVIQSGVASAPQNFAVTAGNQQLVVNWSAPSTTNGGTISSYTLQYLPAGGSWTTASSSLAASATSSTITGLVNGTSYDVRLFAVTAAGNGTTAATSSPVIPAAMAINTAVPIVSGTAAVGRVLSSTTGMWNANGSTITGYSYQWQTSTDGSSGWSDISGATSSTFTMTTAELGLYMRVVVGATNSLGTTTANSLATAVVASGLAAAPTTLTTAAGDSQLVLGWTAPTTLNGGVTSDYEIQYKDSTTSTWTTIRVGSAVTTFTLTGLTNAVSYDWKIGAVTAAGVGTVATWTASLGSTPYTTPSNSAIPTLTGTPAIGRTLSADKGTWSANGRAATYTYQWQISSDGTSFTNLSGATQATYTPSSSADAGKYLRVRVSATNTAGTVSADSVATTAVESGLASAPTSLTSTASNGQLVLSWVVPSALNGGIISDYTVEYKKSSDSAYTTVQVGSSATSVTMTGLTNAVSYDWRVRAVTAAGAGVVATYSGDLASTPFTTPTYTSGVSISGDAVVGSTLTAARGTWSANGRVISYSYMWQSSSDQSLWSDTGVTTASFTPSTQTLAGKYLRVNVTATNEAGATSTTSAATSAVQTGKPSAVQSLAGVFGDGQASISWSAPSTLNGGTLTGYRIAFFDPIIGTWDYSHATVSASTTTYVETGLTNGTTYGFVVIADGTGGEGDFTIVDRVEVIPAAVPSVTSAPTISGSAILTQTLTVSTGSWAANGAAISGYTYQWQSSSTSTGAFADISGATSATYSPVTADVNDYLRVRVTATNLAGSTTETTSVVGPVLGAPISTSIPTITGLTGVGHTVTVSDGGWNDNGNAISLYEYLWQRSSDGTTWVDIAGETTRTYTLASADAGNFVRAVVSARNIGGVASVEVLVAGPGANGEIGSGITSEPTSVSGTVADRSILVGWLPPASLNGGEVANYRVQYSSDGNTWITATSTLSAGSRSYTITGLTNGTSYAVRVIALSVAGVSPAGTDSSGLIPFAAPISASVPTLSGFLAVGEVLTAGAGLWDVNGRTITARDYTWYSSADGTNFAQIGSGSTYTLTTSELGDVIRVVETVTNAAGASSQASVSSTEIQSGLPTGPTNFSASFTPVKMHVEWAAPNSLSGASAVTAYRVQYSLDGIAWTTASDTISSSATSYDITTGLTIGSRYFVRIAAETAAGLGLSTVTPSAVLFGAVPSVTVAPSLSGTTRVLSTMTAGDGTWTGNGDAITATSYQWQRSLTGSSGWTDIAGATSSSYALESADAAHYVRVIVTKVNSIGQTSNASSASSLIGAGPASAPRNLALSREDHQIRLAWDVPQYLNGGSIADYSIEYSDDAGVSWTAVTRTATTATGGVISGLTEGTSYLVRVRAETAVSGEWATSTAVVAIGAPTVTAVPTVSGSTLLAQVLRATHGSWDGHGAAVTSYRYQWQSSADGSTQWSDVAGATSSTMAIAAAHVYYRVKVTALNEAGESVSAAMSTATAYVVSQRASTPTGLQVIPGDHALSVSWTAPTQLGGGTIDNYSVEYSTDGDNWTALTRAASSAPSAEISGLVNGTGYYVRVAAETTVLGQFAVTSNATVPYGAPISLVDPSISGSYIRYDATIYAVSDVWGDNGGTLSAKTFQWQYSADNGGTWNNIAGATGSSYRIGSVVGNVLRVKVTQSNQEGLSTTAYSVATATVAAIAAGAPTAVVVTPADQAMTVSWSAPTAWGGSALSRYDVEYSRDGGSSWTTVTRGSPTALSETITGLVNGQQYTVRIRTVTAVTGNFALTTTTPFGTPLNTAVPSVSGTARFDSVLSATAGSWDSNGSAVTATNYQWQFSADKGTTWSNVFGATVANYTVGSYVGKLIRVQVTTTNAAGNSVSVSGATAAVAPAGAQAPTALTVTAGDQELALNWTAPSYDGGSAIVNYEVEYSTDATTWVAVSRTASSVVTQTITGLTNATGYYVRVRALNGTTGNWVISGATTSPYGAPVSTSLPSISGVITYGQGLSAQAGVFNNNGAAITATTYQWQYSSNGGSTWFPISGAQAANYNIGDHVGHLLRVVVSASNARGTTLHASPATASVAADSPNAPTNIVVTASDQQLGLSWTAPSYLGGAAITTYDIEYSSDNGPWIRVSRATSIQTSQAIAGLANGVDYALRVRAVNGANGAWQTLSTLSRPFGLPLEAVAGSQPTISGTAVFGRTLSATDITWDSNGSSITATSYRWQVENSGVWTDITGATSATYAINAHIGKSVRVMVSSTNAAGTTSIASAPTAVIVPGAASSPSGISSAADDQAATLSWSAPTTTGGALIVDYEVQISEDGNAWTRVNRGPSTSTTQRIAELINGNAYYVRVRALNGSHGDWGFLSSPVVPRGLAVNTVLPVVTGVPQFNGQISVDDGQWDGNGDSVDRISYQWQASSDSGRSWTNIPGATSSVYPVGLYVGSTLRAVVTATNDAGAQSENSEATPVVTAIPAATPLITSQQVSPGTVQVGWTAPAHTGGQTLTGYTVQYSVDGSNWTSVSRGAGDSSATISGLTNGVGYLFRIRAETTQAGEWSPVAGPLTPVAPVQPVTLSAPEPVPAAMTNSTPDVFAPLFSSVMPRSLATTSVTSLTGPSEVIITEDGRIELQPMQTVALVDGQPVNATVSVSGNSVSVSTESTSLALNFGESTSDGGDTQANASTSSLVQGESFTFEGDGFTAASPVVTWIQSTPIKLSEAVSTQEGLVSDEVTIGANIEPGQHTIQVNGMDVNGRVVSIIYGVDVQLLDAPMTAEETRTLLGEAWLWIFLSFFAVALLVVIVVVRRKKSLKI